LFPNTSRGQAGTTTATGNVFMPTTPTLAATVTISTVGFHTGVFPFSVRWFAPPIPGVLSIYAQPDAESPDPTVILVNGTIACGLAPEPDAIVLGLFAAAGLGVVVIRRRQARQAA
jgi:hypothetical protein